MGSQKDVVIFSSVFQCSVIGAILFLVKVNDLTDALQLFFVDCLPKTQKWEAKV